MKALALLSTGADPVCMVLVVCFGGWFIIKL